MAITRSQQRAIDRQQEERAKREQQESSKKHALVMAVKASLEAVPESLGWLERNMSNLNTNDDISVATATTTTMHKLYNLGRLANREHTNDLDQPLNMAPVKKSDTEGLFEFSAAQQAAYREQRRESMFAHVSDTDASANSATYMSNSSGGSGSAMGYVPKKRLSSLSLESELDLLENSETVSSSVVAIQIAERRESVSTQAHTGSTVNYDEFSVNTEHHVVAAAAFSSPSP
ncbi:hypothetical protein V8B55DRAFT_1548028 [Mucor lusitanicus]|uniref:Uncharacterized protein n=2 Tax=Mucor circinelloides f. lusitanicus TaxID=29924 RepID=A0A162Q4J1_MUCCL|nr:hypothetical protein FB192DRAFT_1403854 [Mucor lusitanicus]OAC98909.1 hypothetical protein MUCCIDRAFT_167348 [Mucor lusitanicus CBS 277.49]